MFCVAKNASVTGNFAHKKKRMQIDKMKVLLYLKKSGLDKSGQAPIMGRITYGRTIAQFSCKLSCDPKLWNARESRLNGKSREESLPFGVSGRINRATTVRSHTD